jgi:CDP-diacylglycerol--glycerol-3-phosphate 3-phosphatidyltransferase
MNLANKLTIFRILLVPVFVSLLLTDNLVYALIVFAAASITDFLDGYIARSRNMVTDLGKFLDPIADKILVMAALVCFTGLGWIYSWTVVVILARDFIVGAIRLAAVESEQKIVIPARFSAKLKTAVTMVTICAIMLMGIIKLEIDNRLIADVLMYICTALTVVSAVQYIVDSRGILKNIMEE